MTSPLERKTAVSVSLTPTLLALLDDHAHRLRLSRSQLVADAITSHLLDLEAEADS